MVHPAYTDVPSYADATSFPLFFSCQAEDGILDPLVTGVQTCALPILDTNAALCLAEARPGEVPTGWTAVSGPIGLTDLDADPTALNGSLHKLRVFAGYAG